MAWTPIQGKFGRFTWGANNLSFSHWQLGVDADMIPADGFEKSASNGQYFHQYLAGLIGGEARIGGLFDTQVNNNPSGPTLLIRAGASVGTGGAVASAFLGITTGIGYTVLGKVKHIGPSLDIQKSFDFEFVIQIEDVQYTLQT
jgi:hypothetical protein